MKLITCDRCKTEFRPNSDQLEFIATSRKKGMTFIILDCGNCEMSFPFNPSASYLVEDLSDFSIRTPLSGSHGYVSYIDSEDGTFFGCSETGAIWRKEENLFRDIELIIKKYPHRASCYLQTENGWVANSEQLKNIDDLIDQEEVEELTEYERD